MSIFVDLVSYSLLVAGSFFCVTGAVGLVRMPDVFTRMHAASLCDNVGAPLIILAAILQSGWSLNSARLFLILIIISYSGVVVSHTLARAAIFAGLRPLLNERSGKEAEMVPRDGEDPRRGIAD